MKHPRVTPWTVVFTIIVLSGCGTSPTDPIASGDTGAAVVGEASGGEDLNTFDELNGVAEPSDEEKLLSLCESLLGEWYWWDSVYPADHPARISREWGMKQRITFKTDADLRVKEGFVFLDLTDEVWIEDGKRSDYQESAQKRCAIRLSPQRLEIFDNATTYDITYSPKWKELKLKPVMDISNTNASEETVHVGGVFVRKEELIARINKPDGQFHRALKHLKESGGSRDQKSN